MGNSRLLQVVQDQYAATARSGLSNDSAAVRKVESSLDGQGRLLIRYSGTEPLLRIMIEGKRDDEIKAWAEEIALAVRTHLA